MLIPIRRQDAIDTYAAAIKAIETTLSKYESIIAAENERLIAEAEGYHDKVLTKLDELAALRKQAAALEAEGRSWFSGTFHRAAEIRELEAKIFDLSFSIMPRMPSFGPSTTAQFAEQELGLFKQLVADLEASKADHIQMTNDEVSDMRRAEATARFHQHRLNAVYGVVE